MNDCGNEAGNGNAYHRWLATVTLIPLCWLLMMVVHEWGHVLAAWLTGGTVARVVLHPLCISRTDLASNPHPLLVAWAGPVLGAMMPLLILAGCSLGRLPIVPVARFFAGFCLISNGCYVAFGSIERVGDAGTILHLGSPVWLLWSFGAITIPAGLALWHHLGPYFGFGCPREPMPGWVAYGLLVVLVLVILAELWWQAHEAGNG